MRRPGRAAGFGLAVVSVFCLSAVITHTVEAEGLPAAAVSAPSAVEGVKKGRRYALVIGINDYQHLGKLECCRQDAEQLAKVLLDRAGYDSDFTCLIINGEVPRQFEPLHMHGELLCARDLPGGPHDTF